ncbi:MAG TPA: hypothetical protein VE547_09080 [Mycobacteriales bacterium]|nr:hypothetical protein [Mycobacteriales bacterium]
MRVSALPVLVAATLLAAGAGCATTVEGTGRLAEGVVTGAPSAAPTGSGAPEPTGSSDPTTSPTPPSPTTDPVLIRQRLLCALERASIISINSQFNKTKSRDSQIRVLRSGATTITGHLRRSQLPARDKIRKPGQAVVDQLTKLVRDAGGGGNPSTDPYNLATRRFQTACNAL